MALESHLEEFVQIVESGSVSAAARVLNLPRASLSRRLAKLEASYGVELLHRETHRQSLTKAGQELYQRARKIVAALREAHQTVSALDGVPRGLLRVGIPPGAGIEMVLAKPYIEAFPEVSLEFVAEHSHIDLPSNNIDIALRAGPIKDERLIGRKLVTFRNLVYGSPALLNRLETPSLNMLSNAPCILGFDSSGRPISAWPLWDGGSVPVHGSIRTSDAESRLAGARQALGLIMTSERLVRREVTEGLLVPILTDTVGSTTSVSLVWPPSEFMEPKVRAFIDMASDIIKRLALARDADQ